MKHEEILWLYFRRTRFESVIDGLLDSTPALVKAEVASLQHSPHSMRWKAELEASNAALPIDKVALTLSVGPAESAPSARRNVRALPPVAATRWCAPAQDRL